MEQSGLKTVTPVTVTGGLSAVQRYVSVSLCIVDVVNRGQKLIAMHNCF